MVGALSTTGIYDKNKPHAADNRVNPSAHFRLFVLKPFWPPDVKAEKAAKNGRNALMFF